MEQYDYDTEQSLRVASGMSGMTARPNDEGGGSGDDENSRGGATRGGTLNSTAPDQALSSASSSMHFNNSNGDLPPDPHLTLNTRRRLIRKPLPDLPGQTASRTGQGLPSTAAHSVASAEHGQEHAAADDNLASLPQSALFARNDSARQHAMTLEQAQKRTMEIAGKERAMLEWWPDLEDTGQAGGISEAGQEAWQGREKDTEKTPLLLNATCQAHLARIVECCLLSTREVDEQDSIQLGQVIVAALLRSVETLTEPEALAALQQTSSVLWRVDALVRSNEQLSGAKGGLSALLGVLGVRWPRIPAWRGAEEGNEAHSSSSSSNAGLPSVYNANGLRPTFPSDKRTFSGSSTSTMGTEQRRRKRDVAMQLLNNAFWMAGAGPSDEQHEDDKAGDHARLAGQEHGKRRTAGAAPDLISKPAAPIVALTDNVSEKHEVPRESSNGKDAIAEPKDDAASMASERPSTLTDRLTMQLRNAARSSLDAKASQPKENGVEQGTMSRSVSRSSIAGTTALQSSQRIKISICKVCVRFDDGWGKALAHRLRTRRRSETVTLKGAQRRLDNSSSMSGRSDKTIRTLLRGDSLAEESHVIEWEPAKFDGDPLHLNPLSTDIEGRDFEDTTEGVNVIGGTFAVHGVDEMMQDVIRNTLDVGLYAALAMLLEISFLSDFDVAPNNEEDASREAQHRTSSTKSPQPSSASSQKGSEAEQPGEGHRADQETQQDDGGAGYGHWPRNIWNMLHAYGDTTSVGGKQLHIGLPRTRTTESSSRREKVASHGHYGRFGKMISSLAGNVYKRPSTADDVRGRARSSSDVQHPSSVDSGEQKEQSVADSTAGARGPSPRFVSPYREQNARARPDNDADLATDFMENIVSKQSLSIIVMEGLDVTLPFTQQSPQSASFEGKRGGVTPAGTSDDGTRGSRLSVHSSIGMGPTPSRTSATARTTGASVQSDSNSPSSIPPPRNLPDDDAEVRRREVLFYQRGGSCRDACLGQAIEEMAAKAVMQHSDLLQAEKGKKEKGGDATSHTYRIAQYVHGNDKIFVCASILKTPSRQEASKEPPSEAMTPNTSDAKDVANTLKTDQDLAQTAIQLAEHIQSTQSVQSIEPRRLTPKIGKSESSVHRSSSAELRGRIEMWHADMRTGRQSIARVMSKTSYLASFGTFLEALIDSRFFTRKSPVLLGLREEDKGALDESDDPKHDLVRLFKIGNVVLKFHVQSIMIYDLHIEGPVVFNTARTSKGPSASKASAEAYRDTLTRSLINETRLEIQNFYASLKGEVSRLEQIFVARELDQNGRTVRPSPQPASSRGSVRSMFSDSAEEMSESSSLAESQHSNYSGAAAGPLELLAKLRSSMRKAEFDLYESLRLADALMLNDVRHRFFDRAKSAKTRLVAWSHKHLSNEELEQLGALKFAEPYYFQRGNHAFPGSYYVLRQDEPLSIIAYSLSSRDFNDEMAVSRKHLKHADVLNWRSSIAPGSTDAPASSLLSSSHTASSAASVASSRKTNDLDPDEDEDFSVPEPLQINMKRKKRTKDVGILSLRIRSSVYSNKDHQAMDAASDASLDMQGGNDDSPHGVRKPGHSDGAENASDENAVTPTASRILNSEHLPSSDKFDTVSSSNNTFRAHVSTISPRGALEQIFRQHDDFATSDLAPASEAGLTASALSSSVSSTASGTVNDASQQQTPRTRMQARLPDPPNPGEGNWVESDAQQKTTGKPRLVPGPRLASSQPASPHIKHTLLTGNLKISCVSWFAEDFLKLRKTWGIDDDFIASLSRSKSWSNVGGKSKSGFYLTRDGKWIAKQLLNVWTVDEKEAFLEFAPAYLRYMMNSALNDCPTLLVKIAGVYSLKIKDVKTGEVKLKLSVQVLENVFAGDGGQSIRFDLKGIRDRRAASSKGPQQHNVQQQMQQGTNPNGASDGEGDEKASVWWDAEWIETMQARAYVPEEDKALFRRALRNDLAFLTAANVMDYSLLVGVSEPVPVSGSQKGDKANRRAGFRVRIVDFLGAWTLVKQLESSGKKAIKSQAPTVIPPHDYASRFSKAIEGYFIGCPAAR